MKLEDIVKKLFPSSVNEEFKWDTDGQHNAVRLTKSVQMVDGGMLIQNYHYPAYVLSSTYRRKSVDEYRHDWESEFESETPHYYKVTDGNSYGYRSRCFTPQW